MSKTAWTTSEIDELKEKYGCEILVERAKKEQLNSTQFPSDSYLIEYKIEEEIFHDLTRGTKSTLFDLYYDKFKSKLKSIEYGRGNIKPSLWQYKKPKEKKKRR